MSNGPVVGQPPDFEALAEQLASGMAKAGTGKSLWADLVRNAASMMAALLGFLLASIGIIAAYLAKILARALHVAGPEIDDLGSAALSELFGKASLGGGGGGGDPQATAAALGRGVVAAIIAGSGGGGGDGITPSAAPAEQFLGSNLEVAFRGWLLDLIGEISTVGQVNAFNHLVAATVSALGMGRLTSHALRPAIDTLIAQPMAQQILQAYRPKLLSEGLAVKEVIRGAKDATWLDTELGRQGYSPDRVEAILNDARKFLPIADMERLARDGAVSDQEFTTDATNQGFLSGDADLVRRALELARSDAVAHSEATIYLGLLRAGDYTIDEYQTMIVNLPLAPDEKPFFSALGTIIAAHPRKHLSLADARTALSKNIIDLGTFRDHLSRLGYSDDDAMTLELLEQHTLADKADAAQAKKQIAADKAAAAAQKKVEATAAAAATKASLAATKAAQHAFVVAKQKAASDAAIAKVQQTEAALQAHDQLIAQASAAKLLTETQAAQAKASLAALTAQHKAQAAASTAQQTALDTAQLSVDQAAVSQQVTAEKIAATTKAAKARVTLDEQLLAARAADRVAGFLLARQNVQDALDAGEITAAAAAKKLRSIDLQEKKAVAAENLTALQTSKAQAAADAAVASGQVTLDTVQEKATLIPAQTKKRQDVAAATLADQTALAAQTQTATMAANADIASTRIAALDAANSARATLDAELAAQKIALEQQIEANKPTPPA